MTGTKNTDRTIPAFALRLEKLSYAISAAGGLIGGAVFLLLSFYVTYDVVARKFGGFYSGFTDDMSGYGMAMGSSWAMAYTLVIGGHIRIDLISQKLPSRFRNAFDLFALVTLAIMTSLIAYYCWGLVIESHEIGAKSVSILQAPLEIPQGLLAIGFTWFTIQALIVIALAVIRLVATGQTGLIHAHELPEPVDGQVKPVGDW